MGGLGSGVETEFRQGAFTKAQETLGKQLSGKWTGIGSRYFRYCQRALARGQSCHVGVVFDKVGTPWNSGWEPACVAASSFEAVWMAWS